MVWPAAAFVDPPEEAEQQQDSAQAEQQQQQQQQEGDDEEQWGEEMDGAVEEAVGAQESQLEVTCPEDVEAGTLFASLCDCPSAACLRACLPACLRAAWRSCCVSR